MPESANIEHHRVTIYPQEADSPDRLDVEAGRNLFFHLTRQGYAIASACGGVGTCGKCAVRLHEGRKPPTEPERVHLDEADLDAGWRLSCQQRVDRDMVVTSPIYDETTQAKEQLAHELQIELDPGVRKVFLELDPPGRHDQRSDTTRVAEALGTDDLTFSLPALQNLPNVLRANDFNVTVLLEDERVLDIEPGDTSDALYGLSVDIGTTTLAGYLLDLVTGEELAIRSRMNPQQRLGADVISRIKQVHDRGDEGLVELKEAVIDGINSLVKRVTEAGRIEPSQIAKATIVGNPTMLHLFTGIPPSFIDHSPYTPVLQTGLKFLAKQLGLDLNPEARVHVFPGISGYVGGDITAGLLFSGLHRDDRLSLFVDIGTNAEIVLGNRDHLLACSTPAGPAFEGARIKHGMSATPGAINYARFDPDRDDIRLEVISGVPPRGICGSGLIDLAAELLKVGVIDDKGTLRADGGSPYAARVREADNGQPEFLVADEPEPIVLSQQDIRELQLAKGAIRAGVEVALGELGAAPEDVDMVYLAGAFGNYVRRESVLRLGMLPAFGLESIVALGNAAGQGAKLALLNRGQWAEVRALSRDVHYLELSYHADFSDTFMQSMLFPDETATSGAHPPIGHLKGGAHESRSQT